MTWLGRHRAMLVVLAGLIAAVAIVAITNGHATSGARLDPDNPDPDGARAVARVLDDQGVDVTVVRDADTFDSTRVDPDTTVVVTSTQLLGRSTIRRLRDHASGATLVVVEPGPGTTRALGITAPPSAVTMSRARPADCADPAYDGLDILVDAGVEYPVAGSCFGGLLARPTAEVVLLGAGDALSNDQVLRAGNAAVALRLLGQHPRLVWYVPSLDDLVAGDGVSLATLLPRWLRPTLWLGLICAAALMLWRSRRLGALATEPLPVAVQAIETTRSRGRLYRKAGDRAHAAAALREATRERAVVRLGLGARPDPVTLTRELARHTGRPVDEIEALIGPNAPPPSTDHDLIALASSLAELDREVRRP